MSECNTEQGKKSFWRNKRVLITGGTSGLGRALAIQASTWGAQVVTVSRSGESPFTGIVGIAGDVSRKEDIYRIAAEASAAIGGTVEVLFHSASYLGVTPLRLLMDTECEDFVQVLETNLLGPFRLTKALLPCMLLQRQGWVISISSDAAIHAYPRWGSYSASKAALAHLSRVWQEEWGSFGVRFLAVDPGDMDTPMHAAALPEADPSLLRKPQDVAIEILSQVEFTETALA